MAANEKKRHHFVPIAYLQNFCGDDGKLWVFQKDRIQSRLHLQPAAIAFEKYYYSQPLPDGGRDHNTLEDFFSSIEAQWPPIVVRWENRDSANDRLEVVLQFLSTLRTRVPAMRDFVEISLAEKVKATTRQLHRRGELPPLPTGFEDLLDDLQVSIDPHQSILAMVDLLKGFSVVLDAVGIEIVHNQTDLELLTTDNPVAVFDPDVPDGALMPYVVRPPSGSIELLCPVSSRLMLRGHSDLKYSFVRKGITHRNSVSREEIKRFNRIGARFSYRLAFASSTQSAPLIEKYATVSPVLKSMHVEEGEGEFQFQSYVFGGRPKKPKWRGGQ